MVSASVMDASRIQTGSESAMTLIVVYKFATLIMIVHRALRAVVDNLPSGAAANRDGVVV